MSKIGFGIDVGGSGIKGARVDLETGEFVGDRIKILTPKPATTDAVAETIVAILNQAEWDGPVGITLPSVVKNQHAHTAANIDPSWVNTDLTELFPGTFQNVESMYSMMPMPPVLPRLSSATLMLPMAPSSC